MIPRASMHSIGLARCSQAASRSCSRRTVAAASSSQHSILGMHTSAARTEVKDRVSPPGLIDAKSKQLAELGPGGWTKRLVYGLAALPVWLSTAVQLAARYATRPSSLFSADPSAFKLVPPFPIQEEYINVNGIRLHAVSPGRQPDKPLMLFVHGFPELWYSWRHQMAAAHETGNWDVVALDMRGYNLSDKPQGVENYRLAVLASDIQQAVKALGHDSCTLVAHDWGGMVAWVAAGAYGSQLIKQLIVMGLPHPGVSMTNTTAKQRMKQLYILLFQAPGLAETFLSADNAATVESGILGDPAGIKNKAAMTGDDIAWFRAAMCQPGAPTGTLSYYRALMELVTTASPDDPAWNAVRQKLDMPALVLHGDSDIALGEELLDGIEAAVPDVTVKVLKNCSHWVQQDYPEQVNEIMLEWLNEQISSAQGSEGVAAAPAGQQ